eukprot:CAMPEP_0195058834 /NCGR_PEP_ID=MMETSP0448-20130528/6501_1 /TAXON_ID=66468 /ORGANISM="Heterocapsa triquestra, Strain CCMP 448" /LENGTH=90 /DNA_ID=CAMNT_0040089013 /DNA_START=857 /DNA_END=1129 /DNA_ORIENTATION=-
MERRLIEVVHLEDVRVLELAHHLVLPAGAPRETGMACLQDDCGTIGAAHSSPHHRGRSGTQLLPDVVVHPWELVGQSRLLTFGRLLDADA